MSNTITHKGKILKVKEFKGNLYRANKSANYVIGVSAANNYKNAPMKYFTLNKNETSAYTKYGKPYVKTWKPIQSLILIDILDLKTRRALGEIIGEESLSTAFRIKNGMVSRISEEGTRKHDDAVLKSICESGLPVDGYYMKKIGNNNTYVFHSEVGLCPSAFSKLKLISVIRNRSVVPNQSKRSRVVSKIGRNTTNNNNSNSNNNMNLNNKIKNNNNNNNNFLSQLRTTRKHPRINNKNNNNNSSNKNSGPLRMSNLTNEIMNTENRPLARSLF